MGSSDRKMTFILVRGNGRSSVQLRLSPSALTSLLLSVVLVAPASIGFFGAQDFAPDTDAMSSRAFTLMSELNASAALYHHTRRITFERMPESLRFEPPRIIVEAPEGHADREMATPEERRGILRVESLHLGESISVRPFDEHGDPIPDAFAKINHLWRCRFTDHEVPVDPRLIRLLTELNDLYDRPIHLVSGHRTPYTVGTRPTSQHTMGTAADIRIPGVGTRELQTLARTMGARGVGLYMHKQFVHVDFRKKKKYFWVYSEGGGEQVASAPSRGSTAM